MTYEENAEMFADAMWRWEHEDMPQLEAAGMFEDPRPDTGFEDGDEDLPF